MLNYKKPAFWIIVMAVVACAVVTVCFATNPKQDISQEQRTVHVRITEVEDRSFLAAPVEGASELSSSDLFRVPITNMPISPEPQVGDIVEITYDGVILESYPAQFGTVYSMRVVSQENSLEIGELRVKYPEYFELGTFKSLDGASMSSTESADTPIAVEPDVTAITRSEEQAAIRQAILDHNKSSNPQEYDAVCCSFITLETLSGTPLAGSNTHKIIYYGWALYEEYKVTDDGLKTVVGSHIPVALSFDLDERGYTLTEYWEPRDGSYYAQDIREKFPAHIVKDGMDSQKFILQQTQECYAQAVAATGLDTDKVIGALIEMICSSPALSSNPKDYMDEHAIEYRELTYYGRYTLKYCFAEFLKGGQTDLRGHIMRAAIDDITPEAQLKLYAETGQEYFDAWKDAAISVRKQHDMEWIEKYQPAIYLLLQMINE